MPRPDLETLAWRKVGERFVFLDIGQDRYFTVTDSRRTALFDKLGVKSPGAWRQPTLFPLPPAWRAATQASHDIHDGAFRLADVAAAVWTQRRVERRLSRTSLRTVLVELRCLADQRAQVASTRSGIAATVRAFEHARLLRSAADRCLPRSIALTLRLARLGHRAHCVIGVKDHPFAAHAWVQSGETVLSDSLEEVRRYTPILVI